MTLPRNRDSLKTRLASAAIGIPVIMAAVWLGVPTTAGLAAGVAVMAIAEFCRLGPVLVPPVFAMAAAVAGALIIIGASVGWHLTAPLLAGLVTAPLLLMPLLPAPQRSPAAWAWAVTGVLYIGWTLGLAVLIRQRPDGAAWVSSAVLLTFGIDTAAYLFGKAFGRRKLAPSISPNKTWEGAAAGLAAGAAAALALNVVFALGVAGWQAAAFGLAAGVLCQLGDLAESMIKRAAGAKDAGRIVPGHGGLLDRLDSLLPAFVLLYFCLVFILGVPPA